MSKQGIDFPLLTLSLPYQLKKSAVLLWGTDCHSQCEHWLAPSCQPVSSHVVAWKPGHFLETTSLHPPQAALRRFPRNDTVQGSVDFIGLLKILSYAKPVIPRPVRRLVVGIRSLFAGFLFRSDGCFSFVGPVPPTAHFSQQ